MKSLCLLAVLALGGLVCVKPISADTRVPGSREVKILVEETNLVRGPEIFLGNIALIHASPFLKEVLQKIELGKAPRPGKIKHFSKRRLVSLIQSQRGLPEDALIEVPKNIYVKRASQQIKQQEIREQVNLFLADFFEGKEYELEWIKIRELGLYPEGEVNLSIASKSNVNQQGKLSVFMDILIDGNREDSIRVSGKVALYENILCVVRNLAKGEAILEKDVYFVREKLFGLQRDVVRNIQEIQGKILKTSIQKDNYVKSSWLEEIPLIQKGDLVTLVARRNNLLIVTSGISKEDGYSDKLIRVENIGSGKIVRGMVREKTTVEVIY